MRWTRSGWPVIAKKRRASFAAESIASPPPEPRKTRGSSTGACAASRSASASAGRFAKAPNVE